MTLSELRAIALNESFNNPLSKMRKVESDEIKNFEKLVINDLKQFCNDKYLKDKTDVKTFKCSPSELIVDVLSPNMSQDDRINNYPILKKVFDHITKTASVKNCAFLKAVNTGSGDEGCIYFVFYQKIPKDGTKLDCTIKSSDNRAYY